MILSALIDEMRNAHNDVPESSQASRGGDGLTTLFALGKSRSPIVENSYSVYKNTSGLTETTDYTIDLDRGDIEFVVAPTSAHTVKATFRHANFRNRQWIDAYNDAVDQLNARGFFREILHDTSSVVISANTQKSLMPTGTRDVHQLQIADINGNWCRVSANWSYHEDSNYLVLGWLPTTTMSARVSYIRKIQRSSSTTSTVDIKDEWSELVKRSAGSYFYRKMAGHVALQGNANVEDGHFSFSNLRGQARDLREEFLNEATRMKPSLPAKPISYYIPGGGDI